MKWILALLTAISVSANAGMFDKDKDGNYAALNDLSKKGDAASAAASNEWAKASTQGKEAYAKAVEETKEAVAKLNIKAEDVKADLGATTEELKTKISTYKTEKLLAYAQEYKSLYEKTKTQVADYTTQVKDLKWTQKFSAKGKELKGKLKEYQGQLDTIGNQYGIYAEKLKALGVNLADYGLGKDAE